MTNNEINDTAAAVDEIATLRKEKEALAQQVKRLIKAESRLYESQEEFDAQLKEYKELYELSKKLNATFDIQQIFTYITEYVIRHLEYERVLLFQQFEEMGSYDLCASDGYYDQEEMNRVAGITIRQDEPLLASLLTGAEYLICKPGAEDWNCKAYRAKLLMNEYLIYPLGFHDRPLALLVVGNSVENAEFYHRVSDREGALLSLGNLVGLLSAAVENHVFNITTKKALNQERLAEAKYREIFENVLEGIYQTTPAGRYISCNPATAAILGYDSPKELIESITDIEHQLYVHPERRRELFELMRNRMNVKDFEVEFYRKDGTSQWVLLSTRPVFDSAGEIIHVDGIIQDISERRLAEGAILKLNEELEQRVNDRTQDLETTNQELKQVTRELESAYNVLKSTQSRVLQQEKMASIGQLAAGVAHEINNPVGFIISNLNTLMKYADKITNFCNLQSVAVEELSTMSGAGAPAITAELQRGKTSLKIDYVMEDIGNLITESLEGADRVKKIVENMKSFSRLDESESKSADINGGLESTINIVWNELKYKVTLKREYGNIPQTICNLGQLNQVFMNMLVNAAQAMETTGDITVRTTSDGDNIYITIADTGAGIPANQLNRIFEPFYTTKDVGKGTGLGLSIAYDIVKKHNGEIHVESNIGKGTTFTIVLPVIAG